MSERRHVSTGSPYEPIIGLARAVRIGDTIAVAGTAPLGPDGRTVGKGDVVAQTRRCFEIALAALDQLGASKADVIRTRILTPGKTKGRSGDAASALRLTVGISIREDPGSAALAAVRPG